MADKDYQVNPTIVSDKRILGVVPGKPAVGDRKEIDSKDMGAAGGMFFCVAEIGGFAGPLMMGVLVDATETFLAGTFFLAGLCIGISGLTFVLKS